MALMNVMCDISQFVVVVPIPDKSSATLASYFMQKILLKFGLCQLVVLDNGTPFKGFFIAMCEALYLNHDVLVKRTHIGFTVEHSYRFLNKNVTITAEERDTNDIFVPAGIVAGYIWNSAPIDGTGILRSILAIGRGLYFTLDISLNNLPKLTQNNGQAALDYLKLTDSSRHFSTSILKILIEDRRTAHAERINNNRNLVIFKPGDIVMAKAAIQNDKKKAKVAKFCYADRGPHQIICNTGHDSYFAKKLHKPDSPELNFMAHDLYTFPPFSLKSCEPLDTTDTLYLNQSHDPLANPLKKLYILNYTMINSLRNHLQPLFHLFLITMILLSCQLKSFLLFHQWLNFMKKITLVPPHRLFKKLDDPFSNPLSPLALYKALATIDYLFSSSISLKVLSNLAGFLSK